MVLRDAVTNNMSLVGILDYVNTFGFPTLLAKLGCLFVLERDEADPAQYQGEVTITLGERELGRSPVAADFQDQVTTRVVVNLQGLMLPEPGALRFRLDVDGRELGSWSIMVRQVEGAPAVAPA